MRYEVIRSCWPEESDRQLDPGEIVELKDPGPYLKNGCLEVHDTEGAEPGIPGVEPGGI